MLDRVGADNIGFLCDLFHLANNGDDVDAAVTAYGDRGSPTCRSPTSPAATSPAPATLDLDRLLGQIERSGYAGHVALEYLPTTSTLDSLAWLPVERRG